jgi:predicted enzyme involved in methoxymalonyl-ACP biosynthesis
MIDKIIAELEKMDNQLDNLQIEIDRLRANDSANFKRIAFLEGKANGISMSHLRFKRLIDQTPEGIAWERGQADKE